MDLITVFGTGKKFFKANTATTFGEVDNLLPKNGEDRWVHDVDGEFYVAFNESAEFNGDDNFTIVEV